MGRAAVDRVAVGAVGPEALARARAVRVRVVLEDVTVVASGVAMAAVAGATGRAVDAVVGVMSLGQVDRLSVSSPS